MSKKIIIGNWKMNPMTTKEAKKLFTDVVKSLSKIKKTKVVVCPPFIYLSELKTSSKKIALGAQDTHWEDTGAFTGEISSEMLYAMGVRYVIVGHSERRALGEDNSSINKKIKSALKAGLTPVLCIGEKERDEGHDYLTIIKTDLEEGLNGISRNSIAEIIIAYEPVWAIGKGKTAASPVQFFEMSIFIKKVISDKFGVGALQKLKIIYGGSVNEKNAKEFLEEGRADGFLPGRASLSKEKFMQIIQIAEETK